MLSDQEKCKFAIFANDEVVTALRRPGRSQAVKGLNRLRWKWEVTRVRMGGDLHISIRRNATSP